jgi:hypothetical protein
MKRVPVAENSHSKIKTFSFLLSDKSKTTRVWFPSGQNTHVMAFVRENFPGIFLAKDHHSCVVPTRVVLCILIILEFRVNKMPQWSIFCTNLSLYLLMAFGPENTSTCALGASWPKTITHVFCSLANRTRVVLLFYHVHQCRNVMVSIVACVLCKHWQLKFRRCLSFWCWCAYLNIHRNFDLQSIDYPMLCFINGCDDRGSSNRVNWRKGRVSVQLCKLCHFCSVNTFYHSRKMS